MKIRTPVRNGPATFWLLCDDFRTIHDPNPLANSWKRREAGTAWAQIAVTKTTPVPQHHLCTSLSLSDQLKAILDTFGDGRLGSGRLGSRCRESMQLTLHEVGEEHICAFAGNEEVEEAETVGVPEVEHCHQEKQGEEEAVEAPREAKTLVEVGAESVVVDGESAVEPPEDSARGSRAISPGVLTPSSSFRLTLASWPFDSSETSS